MGRLQFSFRVILLVLTILLAMHSHSHAACVQGEPQVINKSMAASAVVGASSLAIAEIRVNATCLPGSEITAAVASLPAGFSVAKTLMYLNTVYIPSKQYGYISRRYDPAQDEGVLREFRTKIYLLAPEGGSIVPSSAVELGDYSISVALRNSVSNSLRTITGSVLIDNTPPQTLDLANMPLRICKVNDTTGSYLLVSGNVSHSMDNLSGLGKINIYRVSDGGSAWDSGLLKYDSGAIALSFPVSDHPWQQSLNVPLAARVKDGVGNESQLGSSVTINASMINSTYNRKTDVCK